MKKYEIMKKLESLQNERNDIKSIKYWYQSELQRLRMDEIEKEIHSLIEGLTKV